MDPAGTRTIINLRIATPIAAIIAAAAIVIINAIAVVDAVHTKKRDAWKIKC